MIPYDVEQARRDIRQIVDHMKQKLVADVTEAGEEAIRRLEAQAKVFGEHGDLGKAFADASHVLVEEVDFPRILPPEDNAVILNGVDLYTHRQHLCIGIPRGTPPKIPNQKHRVVVFFLPVRPQL